MGPVPVWLIWRLTLIGRKTLVLYVTGWHRSMQKRFPTLYPVVPIVYLATGQAAKSQSPGITPDGRLPPVRSATLDASRI